MDTQTIETLAAELGIPLPAAVVRARTTLDRLAEIAVPLNAQQPRHYLAGQLRGMAERDEAISGDDVVAMVTANRDADSNTEAGQVVQLAIENQQTLLDRALQSSPRELVPVVAKRIEALLDEARKLPSNTPTTSATAIHGSPEAIAAYRALEVLAERHGQLRTLHKALIADATDATALILFSDTRCRPAVAANGRTYVPAGLSDKVSRLRWLMTAEAQAWVPSAKECTEHYLETFRAMQAPSTAAAVVTS